MAPSTELQTIASEDQRFVDRPGDTGTRSVGIESWNEPVLKALSLYVTDPFFRVQSRA
jgi:hypothetical protein